MLKHTAFRLAGLVIFSFLPLTFLVQWNCDLKVLKEMHVLQNSPEEIFGKRCFLHFMEMTTSNCEQHGPTFAVTQCTWKRHTQPFRSSFVLSAFKVKPPPPSFLIKHSTD